MNSTNEEFPMHPQPDAAYIAFEGDRCIASGDLGEVARAAKQALDRNETAVAVFDSSTSAPVELDLRGSLDQVLARLPDISSPPAAGDDAPTAPRGPGRPKLGVVAREITLLPRHWDWLAQQPGGASVAIRKLVEQARRGGEDKDRIRNAQEAAYRFMSVMAGNKPHYEDAIRALFAPDPVRFEKLIADWPADIRAHAAKLAERTFRREPAQAAG
jgi:uncharacterized protein